jgi:hypothetical protein
LAVVLFAILFPAGAKEAKSANWVSGPAIQKMDWANRKNRGLLCNFLLGMVPTNGKPEKPSASLAHR